MLRVGAEHFELGAEELQLVEGVGHPRIGGVALYLGIELRDLTPFVANPPSDL
jgi:hypothetical protein